MKRALLGMCILALAGTVAYAGSHSKTSYQDDVRPIMENQCFMCHGDDAPTLEEFDADKETYEARSQGPRMSNYSETIEFVKGEETGALMRRLDDGSNTEDGNPGNMYVYLGATEEEREKNLAVFKKWVGHWTLKRADDLTEEDKEKFKLAE